MDEQLRPEGVTTAQLQVLKTIREGAGLSGAQLARSCYITPQSAQALLKGLEEDGWITRFKDRENDRILIAQLTPSGERLLRKAEKLVRVIEKRLWTGVAGSDLGQLNAVLEQCLGNLDGDSSTGRAS